VLNVLRSVPLDMGVTVTKIESGAVSGRLHLEGTANCSTPSFGQVRLSLSQRVGSEVADGSRSVWVKPCRTVDRTWSADISSRTGVAFQAGSAMLTVNGTAYNGFEQFQLPTKNSIVTVVNNPNGRSN
jgi:hypothetical protein